MTRKRSNKNNKPTRRTKRPAPRKARRVPIPRLPAAVTKGHRDYMDLVSNPCHGPLVSGFASYGGSITERFRKTYSLTSTTSTCGFVIWFPSYHTNGANATTVASSVPVYNPSNLVWFDNAASSYAPLNSIASPFGMDSASATSGKFLQDPAFDPLSSNTAYARARTLSACLQLEYLGSTSSTQGQVAVIRNASFANLSRGAPGQPWLPPSVDDIFNYSALIERTQLSGHEVIWRPSEASSVLRTTALTGSNNAMVAAKADTAFWSGLAATANTVVSCADPADAAAIVIAWRGWPTGANIASINCVKVVELELAARNNTVEGMPLSSKSTAHIDECVASLDKVNPSWQLGSVVTDAAMALGKKAATQAAMYAMGRVSSAMDSTVDRTFAPAAFRFLGGRRNRFALP